MKIRTTNRNPSFYPLMGITLLIIVILGFALSWAIFLLLIPAVLFTISYNGIELDYANNRYRTFTFAGIFFEGKWLALPTYTHVGLRPVTMTYLNVITNPNLIIMNGGMWLADQTTEVELYLWSEENGKRVLRRGSLKQMYSLSQSIADLMKYELFIHERLARLNKGR